MAKKRKGGCVIGEAVANLKVDEAVALAASIAPPANRTIWFGIRKN